ncbi:MAG: ribosome recycling factor [Eubacteriales bacterium]|mgnify:FL=1|nr:ribosome recycling factor [Eubacteriales bacterium]
MKTDLKEYESKMSKSISAFENELKTIRAGRANPSVLDKVEVEYYGTPTPIPQMAQVSVPDPRTVAIQPWDATTLKSIERAILASDIGITPANDGKVIRLLFPQPTEERRKEICKQIDRDGEGCKVALRNIRRDANDFYKDGKKEGLFTEDEVKQAEKDIQDLTDKKCREVDAVVDRKKKEIMEI